jgi:beta-lactamase class C
MKFMVQLAVVVFSAVAMAGHIQAAEMDRAVIDKEVLAVMQKDRIPGMAIGLVKQGEQSRIFTYGVASKETRKPVTNDTLFELGSITKTFTGTLASYAQVTGHLALTDSVSQYLPELKGTAFGNLSLLNLGTHTTGGLPLQLPEGIQTQAQLTQYLRSWKPARPPGSCRTYANLSVGLLGVIAAKSLGQDFAEAMEKGVFPALGMKNSFVNLPHHKMAEYAEGYTNEGKSVRLKADLIAPSAYGIRSTAADMIRFIEAQLGLLKLEPDLQSALIRTHTGYFKVGVMTQDLIWEQYSYPVDLKTLLKGNSSEMIFNSTPVTTITPPLKPQEDVWLNKTGSTSGFGAYIALIPSKKIGMIILANRSYPIEDRIKLAFDLMNER